MLNRAVIRKGFTLIELLVVIAISVVLFGLIMYPLVKSFNLTRTTQTMVDAQDAARLAVSQISRDIGEAMFIYDSVDTDTFHSTFGTSAVALPIRDLDGNASGVVYLPDARMDMIPPQMIFHCNDSAHGDDSRDFSRKDPDSGLLFAWLPCPVCGSNDVEIRPSLPLKHDSIIVRYFLGLRDNDPTQGWKPYDLASKSPGDENPVVLYRLEIDPNDTSIFPTGMSAQAKRDLYNDPNFFYNASAAPDGRPYWVHWKEKAAPVAASRYQDLVTCTFDNDGRPVGIAPTVSLRFAGIENIDFKSSGTSLDSDEPPTVFKAPDGYWVSASAHNSAPSFNVMLFRANGNTAYATGKDPNPSSNDLWVWRYSYNAGNWQTPVPQFNMTRYLQDGTIERPGGGYPDMAFVTDWSRGTADFAIIPMLYAGSNSISPLDPTVINADRDRRALLLTYDPTSNNYLGTNAKVIADTVRVQVPVGLDGSGDPVYVRYLRTDESDFTPGRNQFWIERPSHIRFSDDLPEIYVGGSVLPVLVDYQVQFNSNNDSIRGSYSTKSRIDVTIGMRVYDPETRIPTNFTLRESVIVGNALR